LLLLCQLLLLQLLLHLEKKEPGQYLAVAALVLLLLTEMAELWLLHAAARALCSQHYQLLQLRLIL
jgi:hypothetical protein